MKRTVTLQWAALFLHRSHTTSIGLVAMNRFIGGLFIECYLPDPSVCTVLSFFGEGPRSRCYGLTAALRLIVQSCDEDDSFFVFIIIIIIYLLQLGFHPVAVVLTLVHTIQMDI
jgi:hypothetical protein